ncbi:hypothetical protein RchiOBHm_Chr2g0126541 [Rosa chinensis]|uniref:Uncharacterized protein n=1 Tax=Rosa chinensis TaxID=74649 RepID=A0A2P6RTW9_ROSCH|nr:hypothetical protein RchiOBHm_Chr2g0126541 [Rosa chinensis]
MTVTEVERDCKSEESLLVLPQYSNSSSESRLHAVSGLNGERGQIGGSFPTRSLQSNTH